MNPIDQLKEIRRNNILRLLAFYNLKRTDLATAMSVSTTYINKILTPNNPVGIGPKNRTRLEEMFQIEPCSLDKDLSELFPINDAKKMITPPPKAFFSNDSSEYNPYKNINRKMLIVPLFLLPEDTGSLEPHTEPDLREAYLDIDFTLLKGVQPSLVKAFQLNRQQHFPKGTIVYIDCSVQEVVSQEDKFYLVGHNGFRKVWRLNSTIDTDGMVILGRIFHIEHSL